MVPPTVQDQKDQKEQNQDQQDNKGQQEQDQNQDQQQGDQEKEENKEEKKEEKEVGEEEDKTEKLLNMFILKDLIKNLDDRDKHIIIMRYFKDKTQTEIAKELKVSQVQVSRLENKILERMRESFEIE